MNLHCLLGIGHTAIHAMLAIWASETWSFDLSTQSAGCLPISGSKVSFFVIRRSDLGTLLTCETWWWSCRIFVSLQSSKSPPLPPQQGAKQREDLRRVRVLWDERVIGMKYSVSVWSALQLCGWDKISPTSSLVCCWREKEFFEFVFVGYNTVPWHNKANYHAARGDPLFRIHTFSPRDNVCGTNKNIQPLQHMSVSSSYCIMIHYYSTWYIPLK